MTKKRSRFMGWLKSDKPATGTAIVPVSSPGTAIIPAPPGIAVPVLVGSPPKTAVARADHVDLTTLPAHELAGMLYYARGLQETYVIREELNCRLGIPRQQLEVPEWFERHD